MAAGGGFAPRSVGIAASEIKFGFFLKFLLLTLSASMIGREASAQRSAWGLGVTKIGDFKGWCKHGDWL